MKNKIPHNIKLPKGYRREFHFINEEAKFRFGLLITPKGIGNYQIGNADKKTQRNVLDWIGCCIESVRDEIKNKPKNS